MTYLLVALVGAAFGALAAFLGSNKVAEPAKRFGLAEAEAAEKYIKTNDQRDAVKGTLLGVLGYENVVAEDAAYAVEELLQANDSKDEAMEANKGEIDSLKEEIAKLEAAVARLQEGKARDKATMVEVEARAKRWA